MAIIKTNIYNNMKTLLNNDVKFTTRGLLYLCELKNDELRILNEVQFRSAAHALEAYANIRNPESQLALGSTYEELCDELMQLHESVFDPIWIKQLKETL